MTSIRERLAEFEHTPNEGDPMVDVLLRLVTDAADEIDRLQTVIDSRPAINAALPGSYIRWSQSIYVMEIARMGRPS